MKKYAIAAAVFVLVAAGAWVVVATAGGTGPASAVQPGAGAASATPTDQEVMFVTMMTDHHEQAVRMGEIIAATADVPHRVANLAGMFQVAQTGEIGDARQWLTAWETAGRAAEAHGGHGSPDAGDAPVMTMKGMIGPDGFAELEAATGTEAARVFLRLMIEHHEGAIDTAAEVSASLSNPWVVSFAQHLINEQSLEVEAMRRMQESLG